MPDDKRIWRYAGGKNPAPDGIRLTLHFVGGRSITEEVCAKIVEKEADVAHKNGWTDAERAAHNIQVLIRSRANEPTVNPR